MIFNLDIWITEKEYIDACKDTDDLIQSIKRGA